ncbi:MAG: divergent polysaccharide deacetylase family protein [Treponema sp.]|nr:divergent polysaccharide deacetylase family protein [Treponema sp.]
MPQKKTKRKSSTKRTKRHTSRKPKVYIPAYKAIIFCCVIITLCMGLLLFTTLKSPDEKVTQAITERFEEEKTETKKEEKKAEKTEKKTQPEIKKEESKKTEISKKAEPKKVETPQVKEEKKPTPTVTPTPAPTPAPAPKTAPAPVPKAEKKSKYNLPAAKNSAQLIFVFDDGGQNLTHLKPFLKLPFPITVAVLPQLIHSKETAAQVRTSGNELILHQPMQSISASVNPGPGAIKPGMGEGEIKSILFQNITEIGPISGMNNHEGSAITADAEQMAVVMNFCSQEGIYFLDSRTNVETKVPYVARELGYSYYERNIFLDNEKTKENALKELKKGLDLANKNGSVIMIGHIWSADFLPAFLQEIYPELKEKGYTFSTVSKSKAKRN